MITINSCQPTYWPADPKKISNLLDFFIAMEFCKHYMKIESCYGGSSDHSPDLLTASTMLVATAIAEK